MGGDGFHPPDDIPKEHLIPNEICQKIKKLIDEHKEGRLRAEGKGSLFFTTFLGYSNKESIPDNLSQEWLDTQDWFLSHAHSRKKGFSIEASDAIEKHFQYLNNHLYAAAESDIEQLRSIYEILEEANR